MRSIKDMSQTMGAKFIILRADIPVYESKIRCEPTSWEKGSVENRELLIKKGKMECDLRIKIIQVVCAYPNSRS